MGGGGNRGDRGQQEPGVKECRKCTGSEAGKKIAERGSPRRWETGYIGENYTTSHNVLQSKKVGDSKNGVIEGYRN